MGRYNRHYVARCRYEGHKEFLLGTVTTEGRNAKEHTVLKLFHELWARISPHPFPDHYTIIPGTIVFVPEKGE